MVMWTFFDELGYALGSPMIIPFLFVRFEGRWCTFRCQLRPGLLQLIRLADVKRWHLVIYYFTLFAITNLHPQVCQQAGRWVWILLRPSVLSLLTLRSEHDVTLKWQYLCCYQWWAVNFVLVFSHELRSRIRLIHCDFLLIRRCNPVTTKKSCRTLKMAEPPSQLLVSKVDARTVITWKWLNIIVLTLISSLDRTRLMIFPA